MNYVAQLLMILVVVSVGSCDRMLVLIQTYAGYGAFSTTVMKARQLPVFIKIRQ